MIIRLAFLLFALVWTGISGAAEMPQVELHTSKGIIVIELDAEKAPRTVKNFLSYVEQHYYDGFIFHRILKDNLIQSGAHTPNLAWYATDPPIRNEATNGLKNLRGSIGMARGGDPHSADSQWFINLVDNDYFDHSARTLDLYGYAVFGRVIKGMEVADAIGKVETHEHKGFQNLPVETVLIERVVQTK